MSRLLIGIFTDIITNWCELYFRENTIYFKDISNCDKNNYPNKIYRVEHSKMLIEILDDQHIQGSAQYFSSIRSRDNFIDSIKNNILKISIDELKKIQHYWKNKKWGYRLN